ncbi:hypothetical protein G5V58_16215 [Nocardioides anomalus]|uniref:Peptidase C39-like domain-containing protein n=1 Tax=Nocardioides anomalus TaxID=2712223 RepID=A0A6G6WFV2_9ACTN|nr:hypothetical protein [Nocardioides anomalus]QIG44114.1 hypothetical protein G5V58_16215 [Nocardioides anomalus]
MDLDLVRGRRQPDQRTCGPSSLVAARILVDPTYRPADFARAAHDLHRTLTRPVAFGHQQLPWPRALGTPPWAAARAMTAFTGRTYRTRVLRWGDRARVLARLEAALAQDLPCPLYVGSTWLPRHVVLAAGSAPEGLTVFNPSSGAVVSLDRAALTGGRLGTTGRWTVPWFAVLPTVGTPAG